MQIPDQLIFKPQEIELLLKIVSESTARGSNMKRAHIHLEEKLIELGRFITAQPDETEILNDDT